MRRDTARMNPAPEIASGVRRGMVPRMNQRDGGAIIGEVLERQGVRFLFTLCGGHISPILVGARQRGITVVDVRDEENADRPYLLRDSS